MKVTLARSNVSYGLTTDLPGIWTKHIKVKTELHQTVIDRCLKSLTQKKLVKCISGSVQVRSRV